MKIKNAVMYMRSIAVTVFALFAALLLLCVQGCYYDKEELLYPKSGDSCTGINAKFSADIHPLIQNNCATSGCHTAADAAGGTVLETYEQISAAAAGINQRCIVEKTMPPGAPLTSAEIAALKCWIDAGAPNN